MIASSQSRPIRAKTLSRVQMFQTRGPEHLTFKHGLAQLKSPYFRKTGNAIVPGPETNR